jgi:6 kDa early secretory antigenic target
MSEQVWNFAGIQAAAGAVQGAASTTAGHLDEGKQALAALANAWGGTGSSAYQSLQARWNHASEELKDALDKLGQTIGEAGSSMSSTESGVTGMFT